MMNSQIDNDDNNYGDFSQQSDSDNSDRKDYKALKNQVKGRTDKKRKNIGEELDNLLQRKLSIFRYI